MNLLAKHFFDYQSFVNLPHKAVQLHKTPPSQAGVDPSAAWAPKSMHVAGKNQAAPAAHANRNRIEPRTGGHRHGRPNKLEFRNWGDRHGELHAQKIVPHKNEWMMELGSDFYEYDEGLGYDRVESTLQHFPTFSQRCVEVGDLEVLTILTLTACTNIVTITIKTIRGFFHFKNRPFVKIQLFNGGQLTEERRSPWRHSINLNELSLDEKLPQKRLATSVPFINKTPDYILAAATFSPSLARYSETAIRRRSQGMGKIAEAQIPRQLQPFRPNVQTQRSRRQRCQNGNQLHFHSLASFRRFKSFVEPIYHLVPPAQLFSVPRSIQLKAPLRISHNYNGSLASKMASTSVPYEGSLKKFEQLAHSPLHSSSPPLSNSSTTVADDSTLMEENYHHISWRHNDAQFKGDEMMTDVSQSFAIQVPRSRLLHCHLLIQIYARGRSATPPPPPSSLNVQERSQTVSPPHCSFTEFLDDDELSMPMHINIPPSILSECDFLPDITDIDIVSAPYDNCLCDITSNGTNEAVTKYCSRSASLLLAEELVTEYFDAAIDEIVNSLNKSAVGAFTTEGISRMIDYNENNRFDSNEHCSLSSSKINTSAEIDHKIHFQRVGEFTSTKQIPYDAASFSQRLNKEKPLQLSSNDSMESENSVLEELENDGEIMQYFECGNDEFSGSSDAENNAIKTIHKMVDAPRRNHSSFASNTSSDNENTKKNMLVGGFVIGALGSSHGRWHWRKMVQRQGHPVFMWHRLIRPEIA